MADKIKYVTVKGKEYQIRKFPARDGNFILIKVGGLLAPIAEPLLKGLGGKNPNLLKPEDVDLQGLNIAALMAPLAAVSEPDFMYLQDKALQVCRVKLGNGYVDVVNDNGSFAVEELEDDGAAVMALMVHALMHNITSFFVESPLTGLFGAIQDSSSQN